MRKKMAAQQPEYRERETEDTDDGPEKWISTGLAGTIFVMAGFLLVLAAVQAEAWSEQGEWLKIGGLLIVTAIHGPLLYEIKRRSKLPP